MYSLNKIEKKNYFKLQFSCAGRNAPVQAGTSRYESVRADTDSETEQGGNRMLGINLRE